MYAMVLQDWVTISGVGTGSTIQTEPDWLDMTPFQDLVAWLDVRDATSGTTLFLETAPSRDDNLFVSMNTGGYLLNPIISSTPLVASLLMGQATVPIAALLRWRISGVVGTWSTTFRIIVSGNAPGLDLSSAAEAPSPSPPMLSSATLASMSK